MSENLKKFYGVLDKLEKLLWKAVLAGVKIGVLLIMLFIAVKFVGVYSSIAGLMVLFFVLISQSIMQDEFGRKFSVLEAQFPLFIVWVLSQFSVVPHLIYLSKIIPMIIGMSVAFYIPVTLLQIMIWLSKIPLQAVVNKVVEANTENTHKVKNQVRLAEMTADEYDMVIEEILEERKAYRTR